MTFFSRIPKMTAVSVLALGVVNFCSAAPKPVDPGEYNHPVRVACVGDSITFGVGAAEGMSYPSQLQGLLGSQWVVRNFGVSARTLLRKGDLPWWNEPAYKDAQKFKPDVVIIMLGTNDTKPQNWVHKDDFYTDYSDLVDVFAKLPSHPSIYVCRPCPVPKPGNYGINEANIQREIPLIDKLAKKKGLGLIDMHAALDGHPELLPDRVHPNNGGALLMAEAAYVAVTGKGLPPEVNSYFADHAVLQRNAANPVWGPAADGDKITVKFAGQTVSTVATNGKWKVVLKPMKANAKPQTMIISNGQGGVRTINDILVGDVWVASGQSNMERQLGPRQGQKEIIGWKEDVASANYPLIRQYQLPEIASAKPLPDGLGTWKVCSPETAANFCAVGFFFIRDLYQSEKIPMAIIHSAWGGRRRKPGPVWTSLKPFLNMPSRLQSWRK